jgi:hypothetical protein
LIADAGAGKGWDEEGGDYCDDYGWEDQGEYDEEGGGDFIAFDVGVAYGEVDEGEGAVVGCDETYSSGDCYDGTVCDGVSECGDTDDLVEDCHLHEQDPIEHVG